MSALVGGQVEEQQPVQRQRVGDVVDGLVHHAVQRRVVLARRQRLDDELDARPQKLDVERHAGHAAQRKRVPQWRFD